VRVDQVGYVTGGPKRARLLSKAAAPAAHFQVLDASGNVVASGQAGHDLGRWSSAFPHVYPLDFSSVSTPGRYTIDVSGPVSARSPTFDVADPSALFSDLAANSVRYLTTQRDGPGVAISVLRRQPSHVQDQRAFVYATPSYRHGRLVGRLHRVGGPVNVAGGWMDAGDTLKYAETASFADVALLYSLRGDPALPGAKDEARFGLDWLLSLWRASPRRLIYQVGLGNGNGRSILGAHDTTWALPERDSALRAAPGSPAHFVKYRPAFRDGPPRAGTSPNLAGRLAAAYALGAQVFARDDPALAARALKAARTIFASAHTRHVHTLVTATPHAFYPETEWRDDMELGATELALAEHGATRARYLRAAAHWATAYAGSPLNGTDTFNLYDVAALAHSELWRAMHGFHVQELGGVSRASLAEDLQGQISLAQRSASRDPFSLGSPYRDDDTVAHALGLTVEGPLLDQMLKTSRYAPFAQTQRDFVLGENAWGVSFVVGAGSRFPQCLHDPVANLDGSLNGIPPIMVGAVVPGPANAADLRGLSLARGYRPCPPKGGNDLRTFDGFGARYEDNVVASPTNEPSLDTAALGLLSFEQAAGK
jgi:hypothetical protein